MYIILFSSPDSVNMLEQYEEISTGVSIIKTSYNLGKTILLFVSEMPIWVRENFSFFLFKPCMVGFILKIMPVVTEWKNIIVLL